LRKWAPRAPSPELKEKIFRSPDSEAASPLFSAGDFTRWLAPALGCFLLVVASLPARFQARSLHAFTNSQFSTAPSRSQTASNLFYSRTPEHSDVNSVPCKHLEYNFGTRAPIISLGSILISYTNRLIE
jgi:hypothetical protein